MNPLVIIGGLGATALSMFGATQVQGADIEDKTARQKHVVPIEVREAVENNDFTAWNIAVPEDAKIREKITEDNFSEFVRMHELRKEGNKEEALAIHEALGLKKPKKHGQHSEAKEVLRLAVESNDYSAWKEALPEKMSETLGGKINEDNFSEFARMHELRKEGNKEEAEKIRQSLELPERQEFKNKGKRMMKHLR